MMSATKNRLGHGQLHRSVRRLGWLGFVVATLAAWPARAQTPQPVPPLPAPQMNFCTPEQARLDGRCPSAVVVAQRGWVVIESPRPLHVGDRFYILSQRLVKSMDPTTGQMGLVPEGEPTGMLVLERVRGGQGAGRIVRNAYAELGDLAVPTERPFRESLIYGPRFPRTTRVVVDVSLGPLFGDGTGFGLLSRIAVEYRFALPIKLAVELGPGALTRGLMLRDSRSSTSRSVNGGTSFAGGARGVLGLALSGFELSMGFGGAIDTGLTRGAALQLGLGARIGSLDGLNITVDSTIFLPGLGRGADFDSTVGAFNIPVHRRVTLAFLGGGGRPLWAFGALGLRTYVTGTGGPGTVILSTSFGGFGMMQRRECPAPSTNSLSCVSGEASSAGPMFHLGLDTRF